jgi:hypothetical protein
LCIVSVFAFASTHLIFQASPTSFFVATRRLLMLMGAFGTCIPVHMVVERRLQMLSIGRQNATKTRGEIDAIFARFVAKDGQFSRFGNAKCVILCA